MTHAALIEQLSSNSSHDRFNAARALGKIASSDDLPVLLQARRAETDAFVKKQLDIAIALCSRPKLEQPPVADDPPIPQAAMQQLRAQAVEWIAGLLLHEIGSKLGLVARSVAREIPDYEESKAKQHIENLQGIFDGIANLKSATALPKPQEFDLAELIEEVLNVETDGKMANISCVGRKPMVVFSDRQLLQLALCNGIRNALEALSSAPSGTELPVIVITWGQTDIDYWITIIDRGTGIVGPVTSAFDIGTSTKKGHHGFGLAIAKQAIETLNGSVALLPSPGGGATYELRWDAKK